MLNEEGNLDGMVSACVDNFDLAGSAGFVYLITKKVSDALNVSKVEDYKFRYKGFDIRKVVDEEIKKTILFSGVIRNILAMKTYLEGIFTGDPARAESLLSAGCFTFSFCAQLHSH